MKSTTLAALSLLLFVTPCLQGQTVPATDVADALNAFRAQAITKIDQDLDANARAFADARNIHVSARWSDWFSPFLDIARAVYDGLTSIQIKKPTSVRSWVKTSLQSADSVKKVFSLHNAFDRFWQDGQDLQLAIDGPAYTASVNAMLDRADDTWFIFFNYESYRRSILNDLNGFDGSSPMRVPRKSSTVDRTGGQVLPTVHAAKNYIYDQLGVLSAEMRLRQLPPARITEITTFIEARRRNLLYSRGGHSSISYSTYLLKGSTPVLCPVTTSLGTVTALERWRTTMLTAYTDNLDVEIQVRLSEMADTGLSLAADTLTEMVSFNLSYEATIAGQAQANEILKDSASLGFSFAKPEVGDLFNTSRTSASNAREQINMIPQQMMDALPGEVSKVLLLIDDTIQYVRTLSDAPNAPAISSLSPTTLLTSSAPQLISIYGSNFKPTGDPNASLLIFIDPANNRYLRAPSYATTTELRYGVTVQSAAGTWSVVVTNTSQAASSPKTFTVVSPPPPSSGSLVVTLSPAGAVSAGAQWRVDGGSYRNSGDTATGLTPGSHTVSFKAVAGYTAPADHTVTITGGAVANDSGAYTAVTASSYTLTLNTSNPDAGGATPSPLVSGNIYSAGAVVQLTANANYGYHFVSWGGDLTGTANPTSITMSGNKTVTANYASGDDRLGTMILTILPPEAAAAGVQWGWNANDYRNSGTSVSSFPGTYIFTIHPVDGWLGPVQKVVTITAGQTTNATVTFTQDTTPGLLTVTLSPPDAVTAGARWRVNGGAAQGNGATLSLPPGTNYTVAFDAVSGWTAPTNRTVTVRRAQTTVVAGYYSPPVRQPVIVSVSPAIGAMSGGTLVTINGINFTAPATVLIGGQPAANVTVLNASQISCLTPSTSLYGSIPVVVQTTDGSATNLNGFAYGIERGIGIDFLNAIGGGAWGVATQGNYAYVGEGSSFLVVNVSNPSSPSLVARLPLPGSVQKITLFGQYAYVAARDAGLLVVDVSDPAVPKLKGFYSTPSSLVQSVVILGGRAYVADQNAGLQIFDLGIPTVPALLSSTNLGTSHFDLSVKATANGILAYVCAGGKLVICDVSDPTSPSIRSQLALGEIVYSIAVAGTRAFVAANSDGLRMVDVSNPDSPTSLGRDANGTWPIAVAAANGLVYSGSGNKGLQVFDYGSGALSLVGGNSTMKGGGWSMVISGNRAYWAGNTYGLQIADVSTPSSPLKLSSFTDSGLYGQYNLVASSGNSLCVLKGLEFLVFDVSNSAQPALRGQLSGVASSSDGPLLVKNGFAYSGKQIISLANPSSPQVVASLPDSFLYNYSLAIVGNTLYAGSVTASDQTRFLTFDVSNPANPISRGTNVLTSIGFGIPQCLAVASSKAVIGISRGNDSVLQIMDVSNVNSSVQILLIGPEQVLSMVVANDLFRKWEL